MSTNFLDAVVKLAAIKQLKEEQIRQIVIETIYGTLSKKINPESNLEVYIDETSGGVKVQFLCEVKEQETNIGEISLTEARQSHGKYVQLGEKVTRVMSLYEFEPKIIKTAQNIIQDKIKRMEDERIKTDFDKQKDTIVSGRIKNIDTIEGYRVDIGYTEALLPPDEQIDNEYYKVNDIIKAYVVNIRVKERGVIVILSRTNPEFVKKLFEAEIPEIFQGIVKIRKIVREPGIRTKIELESTDAKVDCVACCVGTKGTRIDSIRRELHGEQIDIVVYNNDPNIMIAHALGIENVKRVILERGKSASVIVSEEDKLTAI